MDKIERKDYFDLRQRKEYADGIERLINRRAMEMAESRRVRILKGDKEKLRLEFINMLGWPLNIKDKKEYGKIRACTEKLSDFRGMKCTRYQLEVMPDLWFYGILYEPLLQNAGKGFVIASHGGSGSAEVVGGFLMDSANYNYMVERIVRHGVTVFAPQLLMWHREIYGTTSYDRNKTDIALKQLGGGITALEVFCISRSLDFFISDGCAAAGRIGIIGLSYGGMYTLAAAAADVRIAAAVSSCFFNDRLKYAWADWTYFNQAQSFLDAETAALILPRKLYIEIADKDETFAVDSAREEIKRLLDYAEAQKAGSSLKIKIFSGTHELDKSDGGIEFLVNALCV